MLAADAITSCASGVVRVAHPDGSTGPCAHDKEGTATGLDAALKNLRVGLLIVFRSVAVRGAYAPTKKMVSGCFVGSNSDEASGENAWPEGGPL